MTPGRRVAVIGGGIVGLAVADRVLRDDPSAQVSVVEKEHDWARHQTGRNSGVVHSGLYYPPGSLKARWCRAGAASMLAFAREEGVPHRVTGKLVVATAADELDRLAALEQRGLDHGLVVTRLTAEQAREHEPHVAALAALHVAETGIIDYRAVCAVLARRLREAGARLLPGPRGRRGRRRAARGRARDDAGRAGRRRRRQLCGAARRPGGTAARARAVRAHRAVPGRVPRARRPRRRTS